MAKYLGALRNPREFLAPNRFPTVTLEVIHVFID
jgi:hypothetical protein